MADLQNDVRRRLRTRLKAAGFSDQRVGEVLGIDRTQAGRFLKDPSTGVTLDRLETLAGLLDIPVVALLAGEEDELQVLSPSELGVLRRVREMTIEQRFALLIVLDWQQGTFARTARTKGPRPAGVSPTAQEVAQRWQGVSSRAQQVVLELLGFAEETKLQTPATGADPDSADENPAAVPTPQQR